MAATRLIVRAPSPARRQWHGGPDTLQRVLWPIAWSAHDLLMGEELARVRECSTEGCCCSSTAAATGRAGGAAWRYAATSRRLVGIAASPKRFLVSVQALLAVLQACSALAATASTSMSMSGWPRAATTSKVVAGIAP